MLNLKPKEPLVLFIIIFGVLIFSNNIEAKEFYTEKPSWLPSCKIYESGFTKCSTDSIQKLMDQLVIGIPEITEKIGPIDPLKLDKIIFKQDNNEVATVRANLTNLLISGFSDIKIKESRVSKKDFSWETKILIPKMRIDGQYQMKGRVLLLPLTGKGDMFIEIENMNMIMRSKTRLYEKGGFTFYNITQIHGDISLTGVKTNFNNLFNGRNKDIERSTNEFFNENWKEFYEALRPVIQQTVERVIYSILSPTFHLIPANFFVEDIPTSEKLYDKNKHN